MHRHPTAREFFPGGNTWQGFYSLYDYVIEKDARRIFVMKGGPGVGKSRFMRLIGNEMLMRGYNVEFHYCSSDNYSLDGVVLPDIKIALVDGTAPHIIDPQNPGVVDEIIHLGDHWNEKKLAAHRDDVLAVNKKYKRTFRTVYSSLKGAKVAFDEWSGYIRESRNEAEINDLTYKIIRAIFGGDHNPKGNTPHERHLFASAITPDGIVNKYESILQGYHKIFVLKGKPGSGKSKIIKAVQCAAAVAGLGTEVFRCGFAPEDYDAVLIPELKTGIIYTEYPLVSRVSKVCGEITAYNLDAFLEPGKLGSYRVEIEDCSTRFWQLIHRAIAYLKTAKGLHDKMEEYYISSMDFDAVNKRREATLRRILQYAEEQKIN